MQIKSHRDLTVWQRSIELVEAIYLLVASFPREELYGLTSQLKRAAVSISANLAEGHGRATRRDYAHFVAMSMGSAREVDTLLHVALRVKVTEAERICRSVVLLDEVGRMLTALHYSLLHPDPPSPNT